MRVRSRPPVAVPLILTAAAALQAGCLLHAKRGEPPATGEVVVRGNRALTDEEIVSHLALTPSGRWAPWNREPQPFDPGEVAGDEKRIERIYQARGYYSAKVTDVKLDRDDGRMNVAFVVSEGLPTRVARRTITGLEPLPAPLRREVVGDLPLAPGSVLVEDDYEALKELVLERLQAKGYVDAKVTGKVTVMPSTLEATVAVDVVPGDRLRISRVLVFGAVALSRDRIVLASGLHPGDLVTPQALGEAQRRIYALGVFTLVQVEPGAKERPGEVPVAITLHEAPFISVEAGAGLVSEPSESIVQVRGQWQNKNLALGLQRLTLSGSVGYAAVPGFTSLVTGKDEKAGVVGTGRVEYVQPRLARTIFDLSTAVDYTKDVTAAFDYQRVGGHVGFPAHLDFLLPTLTFTPSVNYDYYFAVNEPGQAPVGTPNALQTSGCGSTSAGGTTFQALRSCTLAYVEGLVSIDRRDNPVATRHGWYLTFDAQYAGLPGSTFSYLRLAPELRLYFPLARGWTLALRGRWGGLYNLNGRCDPAAAPGSASACRGLPGVARFFSGGANSVRAIGAEQLGPRQFLVEDNPDFKAGNGHDPYTAGPPVPVGGDRLLEGSVELRMPTSVEDLGVVLFADAGRLDDTTDRNIPQTHFFVADAGIGLRYQTAVGPVRLDFANRLGGWSDVPLGILPSVNDLAAWNQFNRTNPESADASKYRISTGCAGAGYPTKPGDPGFATRFHECYQEGGYLWGLQVLLSIGEAF